MKDLNNKTNVLLNIGCGLLLFLLLFSSYYVITGLNKGLMFNDESFHLLLLSQPEETEWRYQYQKFYHHWFNWLQLGITGKRIFLLLLYTISSSFLTLGIYNWAKKKKLTISKISVTIFYLSFLICNLYNFSLYSRSISYNSLTYVFLQLVIGLFLLYISLDNTNKFKILIAYSVGFFLGLQFFTKFTTAVILGFLIGTFVLFKDLFSVKKYYKGVIFALLGICSVFLYYHFFITNLSEWINNFKEALTLTQNVKKYKTDTIFLNYFNTISEFVLTFFSKYYLKILIVGIGFFLIEFWLSKKIIITNSLLFVLICLFFNYSFFIDYNIQRITCSWKINSYYFTACLLLASILFVIKLFKSYDSVKSLYQKIVGEKVFISILVLILPFLGAFGTSNNIFINTTMYGNTFVLFLVIILIWSKEQSKSLGFWLIFLNLNLYLTLSVFQQSTTCKKSGGSIELKNKLTADYAQNQEIYLDVHQYKYLKYVKKMINKKTKYQSNKTPILCTFDTGTPYMLNAKMPILWYSKNWENNCERIEKSNYELEDLIIIKLKNDEIYKNFVACLEENGVNYPNNYEEILNIDSYNGSKQRVIIEVPKHLLR